MHVLKCVKAPRAALQPKVYHASTGSQQPAVVSRTGHSGPAEYRVPDQAADSCHGPGL